MMLVMYNCHVTTIPNGGIWPGNRALNIYIV